MDIVVPQKAFQASFKVFGTAKTASGQKTPVQYTKEQLGLIEPRAMDRGKMEDMTVTGITQKGPTLRAFLQLGRLERHSTPACHQATDVEAPMGV